MNTISTDFLCPKCISELDCTFNSNKIWCKKCNQNFIIGEEEEWIRISQLWYSPGNPINQTNLMLVDLLKNKEKQYHLVKKALELDGIFLKNSDVLNKGTLPGDDFRDQNNNTYELISCKPILMFDQTPYIQRKIREKLLKYQQKNIDTSKITLIILDFSAPLDGKAQPIFYNQSEFAYEVMQKFERHYFIRPWYIKEMFDLEWGKISKGLENFEIPTQWIMAKHSIIETMNNMAIKIDDNEKWAFPFQITDFFNIFMAPLKSSRILYKYFDIK